MLGGEVADRSRFGDAPALVAAVTADGLLDQGRPTERGTALYTEIRAETTELSAPLFVDLHAEDVAATAQVLNVVLTRARAAMA